MVNITAIFDEYICQGEPSQKEKASIWQTAIGLQAVDGLQTSDYLKATACKHIEGVQMGIHTGYLKDMKSFDEVLEAFDKQMEYLVGLMISSINTIEQVHKEYKPLPYLSLFIEDCVKNGRDVTAGGAEIEVTKKELSKLTGKKVLVDIKEIKRPDKDAQLVAENIAQQLENRVSFRRAMKSCMGRTMKAGALGIKTSCSGRLGGADMARTEFYSEGTIPLQTLRADIEYGFAEANTTYGKVGVKVWIYKGEVLPTKKNEEKTVQEGSDK